MQIHKNLYQISGDLNGLTFDVIGAKWNDANSYILKTESGLIMFDCGNGETMDQIFDNMRYWDLSQDDIKYCLLTHPHIDHSGGAHLLKKMGVELISIKETADAVTTADERCCGYLYHKKMTPVSVDRIVSDGEELNLLGVSIHVGHYPGHSMGCTAYSFRHEGKNHCSEW